MAGAARRFGYTVLPNWRVAAYPAATHTRRLFDLLGVDLVIDVGANCGQFYDIMRDHVGFAGRVVSFEPVPDLASALLARASADPLWSVDTRALAATPGRAEFNVMEDTQFSSFRSPRHDSVTMFEHTNRVREHVMVEVTTLDAVLPPLLAAHQPRSVYLKLDTQGFDMEVLRGAEGVLPHIAGLQTEASIRPIYVDAPPYTDMVDYLTDRGFVMSGIFPNNDGQFPEMVEFDCVMIRPERASSRQASSAM